jgi:glutathione S-transferase
VYQLYIGNKNYSSWSLRPWLLLTELGIPFQEELKAFSDHNWKTFRDFSPTGRVPCLVKDGVVVWDSLAITEFLAEHHVDVWPQSVVARAWARCAAAEMHSGFGLLREMCSMNCSITVQLHHTPPALLKELARLDELWTDGLTRFGGPFLAGNRFTAVDAFYAPVALRIQGYGLELSLGAKAYAERMLALPSLQSWIAAGQREARHEEHEIDCLKYGTLISDVRVK